MPLSTVLDGMESLKSASKPEDNRRRIMKRLLFLAASVLLFSNAFADTDCVTNARGKKVCSNGQTAVAVNPNTGTVKTAQKNQGVVTTGQTANGRAAVNTHTGNAAVSQTNQNGVTTTQTTNGGKAKTKNGKGVYTSPNGTTCVKTADGRGCN
jgi:hypothetical protein